MPPDSPKPPRSTPDLAPQSEPETCVENPNNLSPLRLRNIAYLSELIDMGLTQCRYAHHEVKQAFERFQAGQPTPKGHDPSLQLRRAIGGITHALALQDRLKQKAPLPVRTTPAQALETARATRRQREQLATTLTPGSTRH